MTSGQVEYDPLPVIRFLQEKFLIFVTIKLINFPLGAALQISSYPKFTLTFSSWFYIFLLASYVFNLSGVYLCVGAKGTILFFLEFSQYRLWTTYPFPTGWGRLLYRMCPSGLMFSCTFSVSDTMATGRVSLFPVLMKNRLTEHILGSGCVSQTSCWNCDWNCIDFTDGAWEKLTSLQRQLILSLNIHSSSLS